MIRNTSLVITPDSFQVSPAIMGLPLARPWRRLAAMLTDLLLVAILVHMAGGLVLGLATGWFAFRIAGKVAGTGVRPVGRIVRVAVRTVGALILFIVALNVWSTGTDVVREAVDFRAQASTEGSAPFSALGLATQVTALTGAENEDEARKVAGELANGLRRTGMPEDQVRRTMEDVADDAEQDWMPRAVASALNPSGAAPNPATADSLATAWAAAVSAGDTAAAAALKPRLASALARDSLDALRGDLRDERREKAVLAHRLEQEKERGILASIGALMEDLGIGFGWTGLYFTAFVALWRGQTPGKRMVGIRVVRLNGQPMTLWTSFERFGGYAAGLVTGLLGFAQVYWDRNRQMIHDKIVETVVVIERSA